MMAVQFDCATKANKKRNDVPMQTMLDQTTVNVIANNSIANTSFLNEHFSNKNNLAKFRWWHTSSKPLVSNRAVESVAGTKVLSSSSASDIVPTLNKDMINTNHKTLNKVKEQHVTYLNTSGPCNADTQTPKQKKYNSENVDVSAAAQLAGYMDFCQITQFGNYQQTDEEEHSSHDSQLLVQDSKQCVGLLNPDEEDEMKVTGYRRSRGRTFLCWLCICLSAGLLRLILHWWRHWYLVATHVPCPLEVAEKVLIQEIFQGNHTIFYIKQIQDLKITEIGQRLQQKQTATKNINEKISLNTIHIPDDLVFNEKNLNFSMHFSAAQFKNNKHIRIFNCKQLRYAWDKHTQSFRKLKGLDVNVPNVYFHQQKGLSAQEQLSRRLVYGPNEISIPYKNVKTLLFLEVLNPFYVFQIFSVILWFTYDYYYYACVILLMSIFGISMSIIQTKKNQDTLRDTVHNNGCALVLSEKSEVYKLPTKYLVPGDIIEIPTSGCTLQCDAVLLSGNCILDESMLTGESIPVTKTPLPMKRDVIFDKKEHARHTLFCGTRVIQTRYIGSEKVLAIVLNTGNITAKGGLIRSILYPPPVDYKFEQDSYKFIECLGLIALIGFIYTLVTKIMRQINPVDIVVESLDLITIVVPPALPAAMTVGRFYAQKRLEQRDIYCISPRSINVAGSIDCCCFDKTGTLTEDGLDMWGVVPISPTNQFQIPIKEIGRLPSDNFLFGMVTCHSITIMNGKMMGDPLDLKMFESTGWILEDPKDIPDCQKYGIIHPTIVRQPKKYNISTSDEEDSGLQNAPHQSSMDDLLDDVGLLNGESSNDHGIIREFPFTSNLQRMSVITRRFSEKNFSVYCKGSPEMLQQLCEPSSMPENYSQQLAIFAKQGYRVIAIAYKPLSRKLNYTKTQRLSRENVERDLNFLGFVILENRLKPDTTEVINSLTSANIRTIMVTGDNILTALSVARDCGIVSESQAIVTVNVRQRTNEHHQFQQHPPHNYELYYTLEMGCKDCEPLVNGNGSSVNITTTNSIDYGSDYLKLNGGVLSLSNTSVAFPNSSSLTSVHTCDTWTHQDVEMGLNSTTLANDAITKSGHESMNQDDVGGWRCNYRFAMVGKTWQIVREYFPNEMCNFISRGAIYARMSPDHKQSLIMELQNLDYCVAMCGDGANDCGALKVAHTGISLSETESSIASPFTSRNSTIACVPNVIKEGRAALVTSFGIFKYMAAYSMVQFISVMILYSIDSNLTDKQYLYIDLGLISVFAFFFGKTDAYSGGLAKQVPLSSLISLTPLVSIVLHLMVVVGFQVAGWFQLHRQSWFEPFQHSDKNHLGCYENYTMFAISSFQYIILAFVFSKGAPYRKPIWSNIPFCLTLLVNLCIVIYLVIKPSKWLAEFFQLIMPPNMSFRYWMLIYGILNFIVHVIVETFIVEFLIFKKCQVQRDRNMITSKRKYMRIEYELQSLHSWPEITEVYEAHEIPQEVNPSYVEISAEQNFQLPQKKNALSSFFETENVTSRTRTQ